MKLQHIFAPVAAALILTGCGESRTAEQPAADNGQATIDCIMTRSSVRQYTDQPIGADTVDILLRAAMAAPTAVNAQPWKFVVLENMEMRRALGDSIRGAGDKLVQAPVVILVCGDSEKFIRQQPDFWVQDCSAATENLLLAAHAMGLGAVWCGIYPDMERVQATRTILGLPETLVPLNVIPIGHPAGDPNIKDKYLPENILTIN